MNAEPSGSSFRVAPGIETASLAPQQTAVPNPVTSGSSFSVQDLNLLLNNMFEPPPPLPPGTTTFGVEEPKKEEM